MTEVIDIASELEKAHDHVWLSLQSLRDDPDPSAAAHIFGVWVARDEVEEVMDNYLKVWAAELRHNFRGPSERFQVVRGWVCSTKVHMTTKETT